jgi:predicted ester cyclase
MDLPGFHVDSRGWQQSGDTVTWISTVHSDVFVRMGVDPIKVNTMAVFSGEKLHYFWAALDKETAGKMRFLHFYAEVVNGGNVDAIDKYVAEDMIEHQVVPAGTPSLILADGDCVFVYATWEGTNKVKFMGKPASNKKSSWGVADVIRLVDEKAVEHWGWEDMSGAMAQPSGK